jgi:5-methyltetrahydropteroyltriglutamate--homocysteine methyltransferase
MIFPSTVAGSLPKPAWLAEPNKLWPQWRLQGDELAAAKLDATLLAIKWQEDAGIDIVCDGEMSRQHFVHGFLEFVDGIDFAHKVEMGIRGGRYKAMVPVVRGELKLKGRVHQTEARFARAHTRHKLKFTMPGPMTISDTVADAHYADKIKVAMTFADLLNQEARALEKDGVDVIQFDEPAFNVFMGEVSGWGIEALHRAIDGLKCTTAVHICYGYGIKANIDWKSTLGNEWRQYEEIFPALAKSRIGQVSVECINSHVPLKLLSLLQGKDVLVGVIDVATDKVETPQQVEQVIAEVMKYVPKDKIVACTNCADAARHRRGETDRARQGRGAGAEEIRLARRAAHHIHQFRDFAPLIGLVAAPDGMIDTMRHMIAQDFLFGTPQRRADRADLRHDIDAVALVLDHAGEAPHLAFDAVEPLQRCRLAVFCHAVYIPPGGI